ncbi:MAG: hypothetical protein LBS51_06475 [Oscillospiraceae bacterium]|jgi:ABC-2 type transport system permease protein|nr:hypothetical protein [Oscillospiraceae bacterium]
MLANFGKYSGFILRRERVVSLIWLAACVSAFVGLAAYFPGLMPDEATLNAMAVMLDTPAMTAMMGKVYGAEVFSQAIAMSVDCLSWYLITVAIMNIFLVNRHTRTDEELGRQEMLIALPVGRLTGGAAALAFAVVLNALIAALTAVGLIALNIGGTTVAGALAFGGAIGAVGFVFAGLTLLFAQLFSAARGVTGASMAALGLFYVLRASGDVSGNALSYISPLGLALKTEAFYSNRLSPIVILLVEGAALSAIALTLNAVRDHGVGIIPARKGKAHASRFLQGPFGLAWRLTRTTALWWTVGLLVIGVMYGSVVVDIEDFAADNAMVSAMLEAAGNGSMTEQYVAMLFSIMSMIATVPVALTVMRLRSEEAHGRLEQIIGRSVKRSSLFVGFIVIAFAMSLAALFVTALGMLALSGGAIGAAAVMKAAFAYLPAMWLIVGLISLLIGAAPKLTPLIWVLFGYSFVAVYFGKVIELPDWMAKLSPFGHIPQLPVQEFALAPLAVLTGIAIALSAFGLWRYRARDIY